MTSLIVGYNRSKGGATSERRGERTVRDGRWRGFAWVLHQGSRV